MIEDGSDWDLLLVVSKYGKLLDRYADHARGDGRDPQVLGIPQIESKRFTFVVSDALPPGVTQRRFEKYKDSLLGPHTVEGASEDAPAFFQLPYWASRRQMVVSMRKRRATDRSSWDETEWPLIPTNAIEFLGAARSRSVNPVWTHDRKDLVRLVDTFFGYALIARNHLDLIENRGPGGGVPSVKMAEAEQERRELLLSWRSKC